MCCCRLCTQALLPACFNRLAAPCTATHTTGCTSLAGLVYEIWRALEQLPYTDRFCIYADALKVRTGSGDCAIVAADVPPVCQLPLIS